jgi:hypothetical protein
MRLFSTRALEKDTSFLMLALRDWHEELSGFVFALARHGISDAKLRFTREGTAEIYRTGDIDEVLAIIRMPQPRCLDVEDIALPGPALGELTSRFRYFKAIVFRAAVSPDYIEWRHS